MFNKTLIILSLIFSAHNALAIPTVVGTWDSANCLPFQCTPTPFAWPSRYMQIYDASLFDSAFSINSIEFFKTSSDANLMSFDYVINLSTTNSSSTSYSLTFADNYGADMALFSEGYFAPSNGDFLSFGGDSFFYDPNDGNLLFEISITNMTGIDRNLPRSLQFSFDPGMQRFFGADSTLPEVGTTGWTGIPPPQGLVTGFNTVETVPEPKILILMLIGVSIVMTKNIWGQSKSSGLRAVFDFRI